MKPYTEYIPMVKSLFIDEIKSGLKEGKTIEFVNDNLENSKPEDNIDSLTCYIGVSPKLFFDFTDGNKYIKKDLIRAVIQKLNETEENHFIFYKPMDFELKYKPIKDYKGEEYEELSFIVKFYVKKY